MKEYTLYAIEGLTLTADIVGNLTPKETFKSPEEAREKAKKMVKIHYLIVERDLTQGTIKPSELIYPQSDI